MQVPRLYDRRQGPVAHLQGEQGENDGQAEGSDETKPRTRVRCRDSGDQRLPARMAELLWSGQREGLVDGDRGMATTATAVLSAETVQEAVRHRQVPHEVGIARMEGVATRHEPQGVVSNVGISAGGGSHEQQVVRGNGTDSTRITRWEKPRGAIRGTPRGVRGGVATPPTRLLKGEWYVDVL